MILLVFKFFSQVISLFHIFLFFGFYCFYLKVLRRPNCYLASNFCLFCSISVSCQHKHTYIVLVSLFDGIPTFLGYLIPKTSL